MTRWLIPLVGVIICCESPAIQAGEASSIDPTFPQMVTDHQFQLLLQHPPFARSLDLADSLVLSGAAEVNGQSVITVIDTADGRTMAVSQTPNYLGWKLVEYEKPDNFEVAKASVELASGQVIRVYYDEEKVRAASQLAIRGARERSLRMAVTVITRSILPDRINEISDPVEKGRAIAKFIEGGGFDQAPDDAVKMALSQADPQARGTVMSAAFGRLGSGVNGVPVEDTVRRLDSLENGRDRDFAINGLAHGLAGKDPEGALRWANSISNEGFRKVVVENVSRRINRRR